MRLKSAALFAVCFLFVSFWLHGGARCQSSLGQPLSLAPPPSVTAQGSLPAATSNGRPVDPWENTRAVSPGVLSPRPTAKGSPPTPPEVPMYPPPVILAPPPSAAKNVSPPPAPDEVPPRTATAERSARSAAAKNSPPPATAKDAPAPATTNVWPSTVTDDVPPRTATAERPARSAAAKSSPPPATAKDASSPAVNNISPTPGIGKLSPSQESAANYDGFTVGIDEGEETGRPLPIRPRPAKQSKVRQKPDTSEGPSAIQSLDDAEVEKLKPKLTICQGC
jgi:hypothetical protein